ncbi:type II toxin-antitoxin system Phd/YefM family antitoxin [Seleniivibrio woodruffii]|uniref:Antitoxin Phd_YefM of type II toxin-antitoxin system n=1 Tax=Seleniivibrio woodruffii TaxID=1078050 RepID=A0A4R1K770_9BACT|nr:type II toxin-antitoxin system Phd/YefM family antitoxin [Seleniivibrio woodruffii]TCK59867.1 antitoxin Phd_YefM of type II toxin-antitoxin system [Seleniivibrio woodruffii]TVZ35912.1 antitoxin Phd_YefM of type II toxin-antitoxin system [Seleniivibrio woodruffii]
MYGVKYEIDEMMSASSFSRNMNKVSELLETMKRVVVLRNNTPEMVVLPIAEYEHIKALADLAEHLEIAHLIEKRKEEKYHSLEDVLKENGLG